MHPAVAGTRPTSSSCALRLKAATMDEAGSDPRALPPHPLRRGLTRIVRCHLRAELGGCPSRFSGRSPPCSTGMRKRASFALEEATRRIKGWTRPTAAPPGFGPTFAEARSPLGPAIADAPPLPESVDLVLATSPCAKVGGCCIDTAAAGLASPSGSTNKRVCIQSFGNPS